MEMRERKHIHIHCIMYRKERKKGERGKNEMENKEKGGASIEARRGI